ncbi:MAG: HEAT repeat domain-containing protein, partial [Verrucomicrobia bacterium]|nr:HEAT repeat domain-containing protein [Verrucomicrobiota bacterium]
MFVLKSASFVARMLLAVSFVFIALHARAAELPPPAKAGAPKIHPASDEGELAIKKFKLMPGFKAELWAAEPMFANPVSIAIDEKGRIYVAETFRLHKGVTDIRSHMNWLDEELAAKSTDDLRQLFKKYDVKGLSDFSERITLLEDRTGSGRASHATVFADNIFNSSVDGIGAGLLARKGSVYFTCIPNLWQLQDTKGAGAADVKKPLLTGFGVRVGFLGHDLHGLRIGPDGKLYFSIGDRGGSIKTLEGKLVNNPEAGCIYRCNLDGSELEIFHYGLRNPQELSFDEFGNLFTGDNNSDGGDPARWVYAVEGGDSGWRVGWQFIESSPWTIRRGPWLGERMCYPQHEGQAAFIVPPVANIANGPSGLAYNPGIGLPAALDRHFFLVDFKGGSANSGIHSFAMKPRGAGFEMVDRDHFMWNVLAVDADFGYDGALYLCDWVEGWGMPGKGRIYRVTHSETSRDPVVGEVKKIFAEGFEKRSAKELVTLLSHRDQRVRQEAQFALVDKSAAKELAEVAAKNAGQLARLHGIWGLGQIAAKSKNAAALAPVLPLLADKDAEVRAQAAKVLGDARDTKATDALVKLLADENPRTRSLAAIALGKIGSKNALTPLVAMLREANNADPVLRHAGVSGLVGCGTVQQIAGLKADASPAVRIAAVIALRRLESPEVSVFLADKDPAVVMEAARAIAEVPITGALPQLASLDVKSLVPSLKSEQRSPLLRRVLAANFRVGTADAAKTLARVAASNGTPEPQRLEALDELANWSKPSGRDRITGLWRPIPVRDAKPAVDAFAAVANELLRSAPDAVRAAAAALAAQYSVSQTGDVLFELVSNAQASAKARVEALKALGSFKHVKLAQAVQLASADSSELLRKEATALQSKAGGSGGSAIAPFVAALEKGTTGEKQSALDKLGEVKDAAADAVISAQLDKLLAGTLAKELTLELLEAAAQRTD